MEKKLVEYPFGDDFEVTSTVKDDFQNYGYVIIRNILDSEELDLLKTAVEKDSGIKSNTFSRGDGEGLRATQCLWTNVSDDVAGMVVRSDKMAGTAEALLGDDVYPYHIKMSLKEPYTGGAFTWHQDYGYWYENGCLFPDMGTFYLALDNTTKENGCLKILPGSHKAGRIDHVTQGDQLTSDPKRTEELAGVLPLLHVELRAGDAVFFHSNMLHRSDQNTSPNRRWGFLCAYNTAHNSPLSCDDHPSAPYSKMEKVPNSAIKAASPNLQGIKFQDYDDKRRHSSFFKIQNKKTVQSVS